MTFLINLTMFFKVKCFGPITSFALFFLLSYSFCFVCLAVCVCVLVMGLCYMCHGAGFLVLLSLKFY